ncbi:MAG: 4Fe-4S dicluster domain-containing protein [Promethearchaeota archaeon]|nr:MAG: 4Fe-4S dicluster domain-containing protein [Candidatus Lokiarchaeota archaeon]
MVKVDFELKKKVMDAHIHDTLKYCYQCSRCTDNCPVSEITDNLYDYEYDPRSLILDSFLGFTDNIFGAENQFKIWGCTICDTCDEVCPQNIELTEIFGVLKNMSIKRGEAPEYFTQQASTIYEAGKAIPMSSAVERRREQFDLPAIEAPNLDEVQKILQQTNLIKILEQNKEE